MNDKSKTTTLGCPRPVDSVCEYPTCVEEGHCDAGPYPGCCDDAEVMRLWRECGLPEYFLGNGGTNHKLVAFARRCREVAFPRCTICGGSVDLSNAIKPTVSFGGKRDV